MNKFGTVKNVMQKMMPVQCIDYSVMLTKVFGEPIDTSKAFMYLFRRYGFPNIGSDDYKDLCAYLFHTDDKDIYVYWSMSGGEYHYHLRAVVTDEIYAAIEDELRKEAREYRAHCWLWANQTKGYIHYDPHDLWESDKFLGSDKEKEEVDKYLEEHHNGRFNDETFDALCEWKNKQDILLLDEYQTIEPFPKYGRWKHIDKYNKQAEAAEEQHKWILSRPEGSLIPRVYFAVMKLFKSWTRYTYIRDVYFNMKCKMESGAFPGRSVEYSRHAGYGITEECFNKIVKEYE